MALHPSPPSVPRGIGKGPGSGQAWQVSSMKPLGEPQQITKMEDFLKITESIGKPGMLESISKLMLVFFCSKIVKTNKLNMLVHFPCFVYKADFLHKHAERRQPSSIPNTSHIVKSWRHIWNQFKNFKKEGRVCAKNIDCSFTFANGQRM